MSRAGLAFVTGLAGGVLQGQQRDREEKRQGLRDAMVKTQFDWAQQDRDKQQRLEQGLADAVKPATAEATAPLTPNDDDGNPMPAAGLWQVAGKKYGSQDEATAAATTYNAPEARMQRQGAAYDAAGQPAQGLAMSSAAAQVKAHQQALAEQTRKYQEENYGDALARLRTGDAAGAVAAFNRSGKMKIDGDIKLTPAEREIPGIGKIKSYDATFNMVDADGKVRPMTINTHDATMQSMPYEKQLALLQKGQTSEGRLQQGLATLDLRGKQIELQGEIAAARAARAGSAGSDKTSREERLRYTGLFTEAGRRMSDAQRALSALQRDPMYSMSKPGSQQARELDDLRSSIQGYQDERKTYQSLLAGSQTDAAEKGAGLASARRPDPASPAPAAAPKQAQTKPTDYSNLWK